jgi:hypothetical protein
MGKNNTKKSFDFIVGTDFHMKWKISLLRIREMNNKTLNKW